MQVLLCGNGSMVQRWITRFGIQVNLILMTKQTSVAKFGIQMAMMDIGTIIRVQMEKLPSVKNEKVLYYII